ncbi:MAG TPA: hypothetical protein VJZ72_01485 [Candidatus Limnocylindrales bacterium]|nr:hypothetical protein [Candidatus Limnocylindrales bacterium]
MPARYRALMEAAGLGPAYPELRLTEPKLLPFRRAVEQLLEAQEPYPAYVLDRWWDVVDANLGAALAEHESEHPAEPQTRAAEQPVDYASARPSRATRRRKPAP